jgi:D-beta-D-heptose 7-phosphate kinase/D-beta-D-heptose 1-phosphate adenosyltransferase
MTVSSHERIQPRQELKAILDRAKAQGKKIVFTNGCFDLIHLGHVRLLEKARSLGDVLVVGLNSDSSVTKLKGKGRPVVPEVERAEIVSALSCVDFVTSFEEETPQKIIQELVPDVLVKGGDWSVGQIVGRQVVELNDGEVVSIDLEKGFSTSGIIERIRRASRAELSEK